jgi:hypothetical protein
MGRRQQARLNTAGGSTPRAGKLAGKMTIFLTTADASSVSGAVNWSQPFQLPDSFTFIINKISSRDP